MPELLRVSRGEVTSTEILAALREGRRVIIEMEVLGRTMKMVIREQDGIYYCDTPMKLLTYETEEEIQTCLERYWLAKSTDVRTDDSPATITD